MKARIWFDGYVWRLNIPGIGWSDSPSPEVIFERWYAFLEWAKK
jgi:hypothetical protein